jgi:hypothetical protein
MLKKLNALAHASRYAGDQAAVDASKSSPEREFGGASL